MATDSLCESTAATRTRWRTSRICSTTTFRRKSTVVDCVELVSAFYGREATPELELQAHVFGWCVEWLQAFFLVIDDIMDHSVTRRGSPAGTKWRGWASTRPHLPSPSRNSPMPRRSVSRRSCWSVRAAWITASGGRGMGSSSGAAAQTGSSTSTSGHCRAARRSCMSSVLEPTGRTPAPQVVHQTAAHSANQARRGPVQYPH